MAPWSLVSRSLAALVLLPALALAAPAARPVKQYTIEQFLQTAEVVGASFSPDEQRLLYSSNQTGVFNVFSVPVTGGTPTALTHSTTDNTYARGYFPQDERFLFSRDQGGNELSHLYVQTLEGEERDLTPGDKRLRLPLPRRPAPVVETMGGGGTRRTRP